MRRALGRGGIAAERVEAPIWAETKIDERGIDDASI